MRCRSRSGHTRTSLPIGWHDEAENYWQDDWQWDRPEAPSGPREIEPNPDSDDPAEAQLKEALADEANKTLAHAREAVRQVRQARGYFAPESTNGNGMTASSSASKGSGAFGRGKGKGKPLGPCFVCGKPGHTYS